MNELLLRINHLSMEVNKKQRLQNWEKSIKLLNQMIRLFHKLKFMMKKQWPPEYQDSLAMAYMKLGTAQNNLGLFPASIESYQFAIQLQESLRDSLKEQWPPQYQNHLGGSYMNLGLVQDDLGLLAAAIESFQSAIQLQESLRDSLKEQCPPEYQNDLAGSYINLGSAQRASGLLAAAIESHQSAIQSQESLRDSLKEQWPHRYQNVLATAYMNQGIAQRASGLFAAAIESYQFAIQLQESLRDSLKEHWLPEYQNNLAKAYMNRGGSQSDLGLLAAAIESHQSAIQLQESLRDSLKEQWPHQYQNVLATAYMNQGIAQRASGLFAASIESYQFAIQLQESLRDSLKEQWPPEYQNNLAKACMTLGVTQWDLGLLAAAIESYQSAIQLRESLRDSLKEKWLPEYQNDLAGSYINLGLAQSDLDLLATAIESYQFAIKLQESLRDSLKEQWPHRYQNELATAYRNQGGAQWDLGLLAAAIESFQFAIKLQESLRDSLKEQWPPEYQNDLAGSYISLGAAQRASGLLAAAIESHQSAIQSQESLRDSLKEQWPHQYKDVLATAYMNLGVAQRVSGLFAASIESYQFAIQLQESLRDSLKEQWPPEYQNNLAKAYLNLGIAQNDSAPQASNINTFLQAIQCCETLRLNTGDTGYRPTNKHILRFIEITQLRQTLLPPRMLLPDILHIITTSCELYPEHLEPARELLFTLLRTYLKQSKFVQVIQVLSVLQGRELFNRFQKAQHESVDLPELQAYFEAQNVFKLAIKGYALIQNQEAKKAKELEIEQLRQALLQARADVAKLPAFKFILTPFELSITDLQQDLSHDSARLIWLDFPGDDSSPSIQGVLAIPSSGAADIIWVDLTDVDIKPALRLLTHLFITQDPNARFFSSDSAEDFEMTLYCQLHQRALGLSDDDIQGLNRWNEDESTTSVFNHPALLNKIWAHISALQAKIWLGSVLSDWLARHEIQKIHHLSHGNSHNKPLTLGAEPFLVHHVLPNLSLLRLRQSSTSPNVFNTDSQVQIISCPGEIDDELQPIPFVALEAEMVMQNLPEQSEIGIVSPTRATMINHPFPEHKTSLNVLHISCHGQQQVNGLTKLLLSSREISAYDLWGIVPEHTINLAMINACTGGIVLDNEEGDPQGLIVPLLARANKVITSLLPVNDIVATVFSALFYHFMHTNLSVEQSFLKAKQQIVSGDIPEDILEKMVAVMEPIFAQTDLGRNLMKLQSQLLELTADTYLLHCLAAIVPNVNEAINISSIKEISLGEYLKAEFRERIRLTNIPRVAREIAMAGYQLYG